MHIHRSACFLAVLFLASACAHYETKDHADVCRNPDAQVLTTPKPAAGGGGNEEIQFRLVPEISNGDRPIDPSVFWVRLTGFNEGRKSFMRGWWNAGAEGIPMIYSTEYAYIENEDGAHIRAEPAIYLSSRKDPGQPGEPLRGKFVDINSDEVHASNKHGWSLYGSVYIKFNTPPPMPTSRWRLHLGRIELGNEPAEIPLQSFCFAKGFSTTVWGFGLP